MSTLQEKINKLFERTITPVVKQDPKTANVSGQAKSPGDDEAEKKMQEGDITTDDVIEKLNAIRAGHSLKDQDVYTDLDKYVNDLDVAEKTALFAYLKGISEIVSRQKTGEVAVEPGDPSPDVDMQKNNAPQKSGNQQLPQNTKKSNVHVKHNRGGGGEEMNAPMPIKPVQK
jgi:hypothetical protein